jgi:hypothetical protein
MGTLSTITKLAFAINMADRRDISGEASARAPKSSTEPNSTTQQPQKHEVALITEFRKQFNVTHDARNASLASVAHEEESFTQKLEVIYREQEWILQEIARRLAVCGPYVPMEG